MKAMHFTLFLLGALFSHSIFAGIEISSRFAAVQETTEKNKVCKGLGHFYWEIGDASEVLASGKVGTLFDKNTVYSLASASKLPFATYILQKVKVPNADQLQKMQMSAGYNNFSPISCLFTKTVNGCFNALGNNRLTKSEVGIFYYTDGHDNKLAIDLGMGDFTSRQLTTELQSVLGEDTSFSYNFPDVVGGMRATATGYGVFLRKLLSGQFIMLDYLGSYPICTRKHICSTSLRSPIKKEWHYSINHWIEDDADGDGAFSSVGLYGFYPWISADKQFYGILALQGVPKLAGPPSRNCGGAIRKAWLTGQAVY